MGDGFFGQLTVTDANDLYNAHRFQTKQQIAEIRVGVPLKVINVHGGGLGAVPTVDVQPVINQLDSQGNATAHGVVYGVPAPRVQSASGALILDPIAGDVGHGVPSDRDHSSAQRNNWTVSNPGSFRRHNLSDLVYHPNCLNGGTPTQYLWFLPAGGFVLSDSLGNIITTGASGITIMDAHGNEVVMASSRLAVKPGGSGIVYLGGDGVVGSYDWVQTASGPCTNFVKGRYA